MISIDDLKFYTGIILLIPFLISFGLYFWISLQEILVSMRNYNLKKAKFCNPSHCGYYYHLEEDPESKDCLNPFVSRNLFENLSKQGNQSGCRWSIQVREVQSLRRPASEYKKEFLDTYNAFHISKVWWRVISLLAAIIMILLGLTTSSNIWELIFGK